MIPANLRLFRSHQLVIVRRAVFIAQTMTNNTRKTLFDQLLRNIPDDDVSVDGD